VVNQDPKILESSLTDAARRAARTPPLAQFAPPEADAARNSPNNKITGIDNAAASAPDAPCSTDAARSYRFDERLHDELAALDLAGKSLLLAVSGGADSVALLRGCAALRERLSLKLTAAHLNHGLRGAQADDDARWVAELCRRFDIPCVVERADIPTRAAAQRLGVEEAARDARYEFLARTANEHNCTHVATAHTADDQAETVLHHVLRGTGLAGLRGISRSRPLSDGVALVRPMLALDRAAVEEYLSELGQDYRVDETNADASLTRGRIRHELLPRIEREYNPQVREALHRLAQQAGDVQQTLALLAERLMAAACEHRDADSCRLNCDVLREAPRHLLRESLTVLWRQQNWPRQRMGFAEWDRLAELVLRDGGATLPGGIEATRRGRLLVLRRPAAKSGT